MTDAGRVPWFRSLFVRVFAVGAVVALVAVAVATWATVRSTTVAVQEEQQRSLHTEATVYEALVGHAATHQDWSGAQPLVERLAAQADQRVAVITTDGAVLADSDTPGSGGAEEPGEPPTLSPARARARIDPLDVDTTLLPAAGRPVEEAPPAAQQTAAEASDAEPRPVAPPADACAGVRCTRRLQVPGSVDTRALGPLAAGTGRPWRRLTDRVDTCLEARGLPPVAALTRDFDVWLGPLSKRTSDRAVTQCVVRARRAMLQGSVAPAALMVVGDPGVAPSVAWDLTGSALCRVLGLAAGVLALTLLLSALLAGYVARPLRRLAGAAHRAGEGDLGVRVPEGRRDEVGEVSRAFNQMAARREELESARRRMVSDVSHELRTPVATLRGWLEGAQDGVVDLDDTLVMSLHEEALHLQRLVEDLHLLSLSDAGAFAVHRSTVPLGELVSHVLTTFQPVAERARVSLAHTVPPDVLVHADPVRLRQVLTNLVANAVRHTGPGGDVAVSGADDRVVVTDTGEGIAAEDLPHVFDRFWRPDASRSRATGGSGLGLPIVEQVARAHGGSVQIASTVGVGTTVTVLLGE